MSAVTFIEAPFVATHEAAVGGRVQVLGIGSPVANPTNRQVIFWNPLREIMMVALPDFVATLPDGRRRFFPLNPAFDLISMINVPQLKGKV